MFYICTYCLFTLWANLSVCLFHFQNPAFVPTVVRQFWSVWGHELIAPKIFPTAKTLWDSGMEEKTTEQDSTSADSRINSWHSIFKLKHSSQRPSFREILQRLVQVLKAQGPATYPRIAISEEGITL